MQGYNPAFVVNPPPKRWRMVTPPPEVATPVTPAPGVDAPIVDGGGRRAGASKGFCDSGTKGEPLAVLGAAGRH